MGRYSLNLRPKYRDDELTGGERINQGIGTAIDEYMKYEEAGRTERNAMGAAGAVKLPDDPNNSIGGRLRSIGQRIGIGVTPQPTPTFVPPNAAAVNTSIAQAIPIGRSTDPTRIERGPAAGAPGGAVPLGGARPNISAALDPYVHEGVHGDRYAVDPVHGERVKQALTDEQDEAKIAAAVRAGMPEVEARARVKNNLMRYDEEFGQRTRSANALTFEQRQTLQNQIIASRERVAALARSGRTDSAEYRQAALDLRRQELELRRTAQEQRGEAQVVSAEQAQANSADRGTISNAIDESMATPDQKEASRRNAAERDRRLKNAGQGIDRMKNGRAPREQVAARAQALQREGKSREQIAAQLRAEGYKVQ